MNAVLKYSSKISVNPFMNIYINIAYMCNLNISDGYTNESNLQDI